MRRHLLPTLLLFCLAPCCAELLSGSTPWLPMVNPVNFLLNFGMYVGGVLIIRETVILRKKGWRDILLLGAADGVTEEGVALMSFFNPQWSGKGADATHDRW